MITKKIVRSDFSRNVLTLISGTTIAQAISIGISPILSRIYSPSDFGVFGTFSAIIGLIGLLAGARYEGAIMLPKSDKDAANLFVLSLFFNVVVSLFSLFIILVIRFFVETSTMESEIFKWFYLTPLFVFFVGAAQSFNGWYNRRKKYRNIVQYRISNSGANNLFSLLLGYLRIQINGLITSLLFANIISMFIFYKQIKNDFREFKNDISKERMIHLAKEYKRFPFINSIQALSDAFQINGIIYFVSYFFDKIFVGIFSFALRVLLVPMNFAGAAMAQVFYQHASEIYNKKGDLKQLVNNILVKCILIALPILIILILFGPQLFSFIFGDKWYNAGIYARILAPWILLDFIRAPLSQIPIIVGKQNKLLYLSLVSNCIVFSSMIYAGIVAHNIQTGLVLLSLFQTVYNFGIIIWIYKISSNFNKQA